MSLCLGSGSGDAHSDQAIPGQSRLQGTRLALGPGRASAGESVNAPEVRLARGAGAGWAAAGLRAGTEGPGEGGTEEGRRVCGRELCARVCTLQAPARSLSPPLAPSLPAPSPPSPAPRSSPAPGISAAVTVQAADSSSPSLGRLSTRSERAAPRSSAHRSRPVSPGPSRRQPRGVASRPTRPAAEEREEDGTPTPPPLIRGR